MVNLAKLRKKAKAGKGTTEESKASAGATDAVEPRADDRGAAVPAAKERHAVAADVPLAGPVGEGARPGMSETATGGSDRILRYLESAGEVRGVERQEVVTEQGTQLELLTFLISGEQYGIDINTVVEIVKPRPVTRIPNSHRSIVGILSLRGTIVMLVDARRRLRHPPSPSQSVDARIVVVQNDAETMGFMVDRVLRVVKIGAQDVEPHPVLHSSEHDACVRGVVRQGGALTILLDLSKLLASNDER